MTKKLTLCISPLTEGYVVTKNGNTSAKPSIQSIKDELNTFLDENFNLLNSKNGESMLVLEIYTDLPKCITQ